MIVCILLLLPPVVVAEGGRYRVDPVLTGDGPIRTAVFALMQDRYGFAWFGTRDGLLRYDGYGVRQYTGEAAGDTAGTPDYAMMSIAEDSAGCIWGGRQDGELVRIRRRTGEMTLYRAESRDRYGDARPGYVRSIVVDSRGSLWAATQARSPGETARLYRYDRERDRMIRHDLERNGSTVGGSKISLHIDHVGELWGCWSSPGGVSGRQQYLGRYDPVRDRFITVMVVDQRVNLVIIGETADGRLALSSDKIDPSRAHPVTLFDPGNRSIRTLDLPANSNGHHGGNILPLRLESNGDCWYTGESRVGPNPFSLARAGLFRCPLIASGVGRPDAAKVPPTLLPVMAGVFYQLIGDRSGAIWAGTEEGVFQISPVTSGFVTWRHDPADASTLSAPRIRSVAVDHQGVLWAGTDAGLNRYDRASDHWRRYLWNPADSRSLPNSTINTIYEDRDKTLLFGTNDGPAEYDRQSDRFRFPGLERRAFPGRTSIWSFLRDGSGRLWVGSLGNGVALFDSNGMLLDRFEADPSDPQSITAGGVWSLFEDREGTIWIGTNEGLCRWLPGTRRFKRYVHQPGNARSLGGNRVWAITEDGAGDLWICVTGGGISRYDPGRDDFTTITRHDGLPSNNVYGLVEDRHGVLWISTSRGLVRWNRSLRSFRVYDRQDGLQGDEFAFKAFFKAPDGRLYFGGTEGVTAVDPEEVRVNTHLPPVHVTGFRLLDSLVDGELLDGDTIRLAYNQNFFSFDFAALDYVNPGKNLYTYILAGVDQDWKPIRSRNRVATYTNIEPGDYTFHVRGSNNDGVWNSQGARIIVIIAPPWWATLWFRIAATAVMTMLVAGIVRLRINSIRRSEREKQQSVLHAALESQETERQRIARDLHDGVGQMLAAAGINMSRLAEMIGRTSPQTESELRVPLDRALAIIKRAGDDVRVISHALGISTVRELGLAAALRELLGNVGNDEQKRIELTTTGMEERLPEHLETGLFRITQELVSNALRHSGAAEVMVQIVREGREVRLMVEDNGSGFDPNLVEQGMGRRNIAARASAIGGSLDYDSTPGHGTTVTVVVRTGE